MPTVPEKIAIACLKNAGDQGIFTVGEMYEWMKQEGYDHADSTIRGALQQTCPDSKQYREKRSLFRFHGRNRWSIRHDSSDVQALKENYDLDTKSPHQSVRAINPKKDIIVERFFEEQVAESRMGKREGLIVLHELIDLSGFVEGWGRRFFEVWHDGDGKSPNVDLCLFNAQGKKDEDIRGVAIRYVPKKSGGFVAQTLDGIKVLYAADRNSETTKPAAVQIIPQDLFLIIVEGRPSDKEIRSFYEIWNRRFELGWIEFDDNRIGTLFFPEQIDKEILETFGID